MEVFFMEHEQILRRKKGYLYPLPKNDLWSSLGWLIQA
jgi:hypothetical protein